MDEQGWHTAATFLSAYSAPTSMDKQPVTLAQMNALVRSCPGFSGCTLEA